MVVEVLIVLALIWVVAAVVQDFRKREIPNWLNFSLLTFALAFRLFYSIFSNDYRVILYGLVGVGIFFLIAHGFYYARLFAGGDAKLLIALGAIIPFSVDWYENLLIGFVFTIALLLLGAIYSSLYSVSLAFLNRERFGKEFYSRLKRGKEYFILAIGLFALFTLSGLYFDRVALVMLGLIIFVFPFLYVYTKSVENSCMLTYVSASKLTVGDWIVDPIKIKSKKVVPHWEGLSERDVEFLKKNHKGKVLVKQGIPFSPAFLLALLTIIAIRYLWASDWGFWQFF